MTELDAQVRVAILTVSDAGARGERADLSGDEIARWASARASVVAARAIVADAATDITRQLVTWCDDDVADLVLTTGGTGLAPRDATPEATSAAIERDAPGIAERLRWMAGQATPRAALSRGRAGVRRNTLIVNLPGSPAGVRDALAALDPIVDHACDIVRGRRTAHSRPQDPAT